MGHIKTGRMSRDNARGNEIRTVDGKPSPVGSYYLNLDAELAAHPERRRGPTPAEEAEALERLKALNSTDHHRKGAAQHGD